MKQSVIFLFFMAFLSLLSSCVQPRLVYRLEGKTPDEGHYYRGLHYLHATNDSIHVVAAFDKKVTIGDVDYLLFDAEIANFSTKRVLVNPRNFGSFPLDNGFNRIIIDQAPVFIPFEDPELRMLHDDRQAAQNEADAKNAQTAGIVIAFVAVAAVTTAAIVETVRDNKDNTAGSHRKSADNESGHLHRYNNYYYDSDPIVPYSLNYTAPAAPLLSVNERFAQRESYLLYGWARTLRRSHLLPGAAIRGDILVRAQPGAAFNLLKFEIEGRSVELKFKQEQYSGI